MKGLSVIVAAFILMFGTAASQAGTAHRSRHATMHAHNVHMMHDRNTKMMRDNMMRGTNMGRGMTTMHGGFSGLQGGMQSMGHMGGRTR
jgi:hypothetical protein